MPQSIGQVLLRAVVKSLSGRYLVYFSQLLSMMVLARIYTPEQIGIFAVIQVFASFFLLFSEMGLAPAIINHPNFNVRDRDGVFSVTFIVGVVIFLLFIIFIPQIASFYERDSYLYLFIPVALSVIFSALMIVPIASLQKEKRFITIAKCDITGEVMSLLTVVIISYLIEPLWGLALKPLINAKFRFFMCWYYSLGTSNGRAKFGRNLDAVKPLLSFSSYQLGFNVLNYFSRNLDNVLVGKYLSMQSLGIYDQAYRLMKYPLLLFTFAITPAIQPVLSQLKNDTLAFERLHHKFIKYLTLIGVFVGIFIYFLSPFIVAIVLGDKWEEVVPIIQILSLSIPIQVVLGTSGGFYQAAGRTDLLFKCGIFSSITTVSAIVYGVLLEDLLILCWALLLSFIINFIQCYYLMAKYLFPNGLRLFLKHIYLGVTINVIFIFYVGITTLNLI